MLVNTIVQAADYEEVSYDSLLNELSGKKNKLITNASNSMLYSDIQIHAGYAWVGTSSQVKYDGHSEMFFQNGMQLNLGIDLFSYNWLAEGSYKNFGTQSTASKKTSLREFDLKVIYRDHITERLDYRLGAGLSTRYLKFKNSKINKSETTPFSLLSAGIESHLSKNMSLGLESSIKTSMLSESIDKNAIDLSFKLEASF